MAYVNKKDIQDIRAALKKAYPDFKLSVSKNKYLSTVQIKILSGPLNFWNLKGQNRNLRNYKDYIQLMNMHNK